MLSTRLLCHSFALYYIVDVELYVLYYMLLVINTSFVLCVPSGHNIR